MADSKISPSMIWTLPFFSDLKVEEKAELLKVAYFRHTRRGEMLFLQGDPITQLYWVGSGVVQMFRETPDGHEMTVALRIAGDAIFDPDANGLSLHHTMNARSVKEATLLVVPAAWMQEHLNSFADKFVTLLSQRLLESQIEVEHQATMSAVQVTIRFLQYLCVQYDFDPHGFDLPYTKTLIASRLGMSLENFSRTLPQLKKFGITVKGKRVSFDDIVAAQQASCNFCSAMGECHVHKIMKNLAEERQPFRRMEAAG